MDDVLALNFLFGILLVGGAMVLFVVAPLWVMVRQGYATWTSSVLRVALIAVVLVGGGLLQVSPVLVILAMVAVSVGYQWLENMVMAHMERRARALDPALTRIFSGNGEAVITELLDRQARGNSFSAEDNLVLATAYTFGGDGVVAEMYALAAQKMLELDGTSAFRSKHARRIYTFAQTSVADAWARQGRFDDAARLIQEILPQSVLPNHERAVTAFYFYLAGQHDQAAAELVRLKPVGRAWRAKIITEQFQLMVALLRHRLHKQDTRSMMATLAVHYHMWEATYQRNAHNLYGERLREVLDELQPLLTARD
ncbi:MAG: hypothetical protein GYB65_17755 [Chloroflexi bacterium]|nr:hypothetical protein [Chloroflexota bacterium]